ncbi:MAG: Transcriptional regulatory protein QseF [Planctomycetota bacterium]
MDARVGERGEASSQMATPDGATAGSLNGHSAGASNGSSNGSPFAARLRGSTARRWDRLVGESAAARSLEATLRRAAMVESTVLITGETGCGKEEIARAVHAHGPRADKPFVAVNCGAMAATLIESQLFGHEKGSFTGAVGPSRGVFRAAERGIVFLDEIGEMPLDLQPRLLRVLQQREVTPVGSTESFPVDVQVIAATNRDLTAEIREGRFREDLYYRLNTIELAVPPLRDRAADIPLFVDHFRLHFADKFSMSAWEPDASTLARFMRYRWPGNVRQLCQIVERVYALGQPPMLPDDDDMPAPESQDLSAEAMAVLPLSIEAPLPIVNLEELRKMAVRQALAMTDGHKGKAAQLLGVHLNTMTRLVEEAMPEASRRRVRPSRRTLPK